jgi:hypothetical protein
MAFERLFQTPQLQYAKKKKRQKKTKKREQGATVDKSTVEGNS